MTRPVDEVRQFVREAFIEPARRRGETTVRVVAGEVHRALRFHNRVPLVCHALRSRPLLEECGLRIVKEEGPPSGQSTTVAFVYELASPGAPLSETAGPSRPGPLAGLWCLRGVGKALFEELGGGEAFVRAERESFYGREGNGE